MFAWRMEMASEFPMGKHMVSVLQLQIRTFAGFGRPRGSVSLRNKRISNRVGKDRDAAMQVAESCVESRKSKKKRKGNADGELTKEEVLEGKSHALSRLKRRTRSSLGMDYYGQLELGDESSWSSHMPVMLGEVLQVFQRSRLRSFVDCTLGAGGHSSAIIQAHPEMQGYVGMDVDPAALELGRSKLDGVCRNNSTNSDLSLKTNTHLLNFKHIKSVVRNDPHGLFVHGVDGIFMDLGMSSMQVNDPRRGFSVMGDGPLDMRMNPQASLKAEDILNLWPEAEVGRVLSQYGEESNWRLLLKKIINARNHGGLHSTTELVDLIQRASSRYGRHGWIKTATRVFQALRIAVNDELKTLEEALSACFDCLSPGGRLAVISFHSLEDRIVKHTFLDIIKKEDVCGYGDESLKWREKAGRLEEEVWCKGKIEGRNGVIFTKRPITPSEEEEELNPRCRSAKLRVIQKNDSSKSL